MEESLRRIESEGIETFINAVSEAIRRHAPPEPRALATLGLEPTLTTAECAAYLRLDNSTVTAYCRSGVLRASKVGRRWLVRKSALEEFAHRPAEPKVLQFAPSVNEEAARILQQLRTKR